MEDYGQRVEFCNWMQLVWLPKIIIYCRDLYIALFITSGLAISTARPLVVEALQD